MTPFEKHVRASSTDALCWFTHHKWRILNNAAKQQLNQSKLMFQISQTNSKYMFQHCDDSASVPGMTCRDPSTCFLWTGRWAETFEYCKIKNTCIWDFYCCEPWGCAIYEIFEIMFPKGGEHSISSLHSGSVCCNKTQSWVRPNGEFVLKTLRIPKW